MNIVYVSKDIGFLSVDRDIVVLGEERKIPTKLIDMIVVLSNVEINSKSMLKLSKANIPILFVSSDNRDFSLTLPQISKNSDIKALQYRALDRRVDIARAIVYRKFETHLEILKEFDLKMEHQKHLDALDISRSVDELLGVEGRFARDYFELYFRLFPKLFAKGHRSKNPPLDPVNSMLSYIYTLAYHLLTSRLYMSGFEPSISYLHTPFRSHYALASDIMEFFRAEINRFVYKLFVEDRYFRIDDFSSKNGVYLKTQKRSELWGVLGAFIKGLQSKEVLVWLRKELHTKEGS